MFLNANKKASSLMQNVMFAVAMRWSDRIIGVISTLILARLLTPDDFGIIAMGSLVVALVDALLDFQGAGIASALIHNTQAERKDYDTAWTLRLLQAAIAALIIALIAAPIAANYYSEKRVLLVMQVMSISVLISGLENIGIVLYQKRMEFGKDFFFFFTRRLFTFFVTLILALILKSYWAMVWGTLFGRSFGVLLSYWLCDYRPRLSFGKFGEIWGFSKWLLFRNVGLYGVQSIDKLIVGRVSNATVLGAYSLADDIAALPTMELMAPIGRVLFPHFAQLVGRGDSIANTFYLAYASQVLVILPIAVGIALVADIAVPLLLGRQWEIAIPFIQVLALANAASLFINAPNYVLLAQGRVKAIAAFTWVNFLMLVCMFAFYARNDALDIAKLRLFVSVLMIFIMFWLVKKTISGVDLKSIFSHVWRPSTAAVVMSITVSAIPIDGGQGMLVPLLVKILVGMLSYLGTVFLLWKLCQNQDCAEKYILDKLVTFFRRKHA